MFAPVTKWSALVATPPSVPEMIRKAFKLAQTERPGAVYLAVPEDVESAVVPADAGPLRVNIPRPDDPSAAQVERAAEILRSARNPIVLAGHGAARSGASAAVRRFAESLDIPVATTFHGKGVMPDDHPLLLGAVGFMRRDYVNFGFDQADAIVAAGYELQEFDPIRINPRGDTRIIHIHRFPAEVDAHYDVAVGLHADIGRSLDALAAAVTRDHPPSSGDQRIRELLSGELDRGRTDDRFPLAPARIVADTRTALQRNDIVLVDTGAEDVDGQALPDVRAEHVPDLQWTVDDGMDAARGDRSQDRPAHRKGSRRHRRWCVSDEFAGDRDRAAGRDTDRGIPSGWMTPTD